MLYKEKALIQLSILMLLLIPSAAYSASCKVDGKWYPYSSPMCSSNPQPDRVSVPASRQSAPADFCTVDLSDIEAEREWLIAESSTGRIKSGVQKQLDDSANARRAAVLKCIENSKAFAHHD